MILTSNTEATENKVDFLNYVYTVKGFQFHSNNSLQLFELKGKKQNTIPALLLPLGFLHSTDLCPLSPQLKQVIGLNPSLPPCGSGLRTGHGFATDLGTACSLLPPESSKRAMPHFELINKFTTVN